MKVRPCLVIVKNDHILLLEYHYGGQKVFAIPGGNPISGEQMEDTLVREMKEEIGLNVVVGKLLIITQGSRKNGKEEILHCVFAAQKTNGTPKLNPHHTKAKGFHWVHIEALESSEISMYPNIGAMLSTVLGKEKNKGKGIKYIPKISQPWF